MPSNPEVRDECPSQKKVGRRGRSSRGSAAGGGGPLRFAPSTHDHTCVFRFVTFRNPSHPPFEVEDLYACLPMCYTVFQGGTGGLGGGGGVVGREASNDALPGHLCRLKGGWGVLGGGVSPLGAGRGAGVGNVTTIVVPAFSFSLPTRLPIWGRGGRFREAFALGRSLSFVLPALVVCTASTSCGGFSLGVG